MSRSVLLHPSTGPAGLRQSLTDAGHLVITLGPPAGPASARALRRAARGTDAVLLDARAGGTAAAVASVLLAALDRPRVVALADGATTTPALAVLARRADLVIAADGSTADRAHVVRSRRVEVAAHPSAVELAGWLTEPLA